jgi:hypothetical protein
MGALGPTVFCLVGLVASSGGGSPGTSSSGAPSPRAGIQEAADPGSAMAAAARSFLAALEPGRRAKAAFPFNSDERLNWHFIPRQRQGVAIKDMTSAERRAALALLKTGVSERGFAKVDAILHLEEVLAVVEGSAMRDPELYYFTVFGEPADTGAWGWRYEGHHASLNWTIVNGRLAGSAPQFLGAHPADVSQGPREGARALAVEEDLARTLVHSLSPPQRSAAILNASAPRDIVTGASREAAISEDKGLGYAQLTAEQQGLLLSLIQEYASTQTSPVAQARLARVKGELPGVKLAWMGGIERGQGHYYRIQGATFLIEYDNTQDGANHIHCVWRDFKGDWGKDVLAEHYRTAPHHAEYRKAHPADASKSAADE